MNTVTPAARLNARTAVVSAGSNAHGTAAAACVGTAGRSASVGSGNGATPASCVRQYASCASRTGPCNQVRCHTAKSAYCSGNGASGDGCPAVKAAYNAVNSRTRIPSDHPSLTA